MCGSAEGPTPEQLLRWRVGLALCMAVEREMAYFASKVPVFFYDAQGKVVAGP